MLIMDEPTTGLDVTTEATILDLVADLKQRLNAGILYVSHNLGVIARVADRVVVMYVGQTVEQAPVGQLFKSPKHPYTTGLLDCVPQPPADGGTVTKLRSIPGAVYAAVEAAGTAQIHHLEKREDLVGASGKAGYDGRYQSKAITNEVHSLCCRERCLSSTPRRTLRLV